MIHSFASHGKAIGLQLSCRAAFCVRRWNHTINTKKLNLSPITSVKDGLKKYVRWYPQDTVTYSTIQTYLDLITGKNRAENILVGVIYESDALRKNSRILDSLLSDPLSAQNRSWFGPLANRSRESNNLIMYDHLQSPDVQLPGAFERSLEKFEIPLPLLSPDHRPQYPLALEPLDSKHNSLVFLEVNKKQDVHKLTDNCHFFIYVTSEFSTLMDRLPRHVQKKIMLTVIDNSEFSPDSTSESPVTFEKTTKVIHHSIKVNSALAFRGISAFLDRDIEASSEYFDDLKHSNILEVCKFLTWFLRTENITTWMLQIIQTEIARNNLSETSIKQIYTDLKLNDLVKCSNVMHTELQKKIIPDTDAFFRHKLRWWMLYLKNDNVEYYLKDFFNRNFMSRSIESYNYVRGQLTARLQDHKFAEYADKVGVFNPLKEFKLNLVNDRITQEIQPAVYGILSTAFIYYQLPLTIISALGYFLVGIQANTSFAILLLGWVLGFKHVASQWDTFTKKWRSDLFEEIRLTISHGCIDEGLMKELNTRYEEAKTLSKIKQQVLEALQKHM